jgi:hypothetical protein
MQRAYLFESFLSMLKTGPKVVSIHDWFQMVHGSHTVWQLHYVGTARWPLHVVRELKRNRGKKLGNAVRVRGRERKQEMEEKEREANIERRE